MSQHNPGKVRSFKAGETLSAGFVVAVSAANEVKRWLTQTSNIVGVTLDASAQTGAAAPIVLDGTVKVVCGASVSAGAIVGPMTDSGKVVERANAATSTAKTIGVALESGSTDGTIEIALIIRNSAQA